MKLKAGDTIFWRWKDGNRGSFREDIISEVKGELVTFDEYFRYNRSWLKISELEMIKA